MYLLLAAADAAAVTAAAAAVLMCLPLLLIWASSTLCLLLDWLPQTLQCTMWAPWRTAPSLTPAATATSRLSSRWARARSSRVRRLLGLCNFVGWVVGATGVMGF